MVPGLGRCREKNIRVQGSSSTTTQVSDSLSSVPKMYVTCDEVRVQGGAHASSQGQPKGLGSCWASSDAPRGASRSGAPTLRRYHSLAKPVHIQPSPWGVTVSRRIAGHGLQRRLTGAKNRPQEVHDFSNEQIPRVEVRRPTQGTILCLFTPRAGHGAHPHSLKPAPRHRGRTAAQVGRALLQPAPWLGRGGCTPH